jgi:acetyl-CoA C-acetyltransferase
MDLRSPVVVAARRTPVATTGRGLARIDAAGLAGPVLAALVDDLYGVHGGVRHGTAHGTTRPDDVRVDDVVLGNCCGPGGDVARVSVLAAGLGVEVPGVTVDRQCGSGLEAVRLAASLIAGGAADVVLAGGVESASTAPWRMTRTHAPTEEPRLYTRAPFAPPGFPDPEMGEAAEAVAAMCGVTRERQDAYAERSHARAVAARDAGLFEDELVPVGGVGSDDRPRANLTAAALSRFRPAFTDGGTVTAGNSCGINDGAAAVALVPEELRAAAGLPGLRVLATAVCGVDPSTPGLGPVPAVEAVLARAGLQLSDVDVLEITEAFAAQVLACTDELGLDALGADAGRVCPDGGAIALGHPWGASGALLMVRLFSRLVRQVRGPGHRRGEQPDAPRYGVATCAIGGGQGVAVLVERVG